MQKSVYPIRTPEKSGWPPNGVAGLQLRLTPRTTSAALTWRGGVVFHMAPVRMVTEYRVPLLEMAGAAVARSGTALKVWPVTLG